MRAPLLKRHLLLSAVSSMFVNTPLPMNISGLQNTGSILGLILVIQLVTGVLVSMHQVPHVDQAFLSVEHLMRDVQQGWLLRQAHANGASFFFILVQLHMGRGIQQSSQRAPRMALWGLGVLLFFLLILTAFLGYCLVQGQMSLWGATVITNLMSVLPWVGDAFVQLLWGGFSVDQATLNRFFSLHFLMPFLLVAVVLLHLFTLHEAGSSNPDLIQGMKQVFHPQHSWKDLLGVLLFFHAFAGFVFFAPNLMGHSDNQIPANPLVTPASIVPEWQLLPFQAILRAIPNKVLGVVAMGSAIALPALLGLFARRSVARHPIDRFVFWLFVVDFFLLIWIGAKPIVSPQIEVGQALTAGYFLFFFWLCR